MTAAPNALAAFSAVDFGDEQESPDVWSNPLFHVDALHGDVLDRITAEFFARTRANPVGFVLAGPPGTGKSHLLNILRCRVQAGGGWFVRIDVSLPGDFWALAAAESSASLLRRMGGGRTQAGAALLALLSRLNADKVARGALTGNAQAVRERKSSVDLLLAMLASVEPVETPRRQDVVRALALCDSRDKDISEFAASWLRGDPVDQTRLSGLGFRAPPPAAAEIVHGILWVLSLSGPTLIVVEGIDALIDKSTATVGGKIDSEPLREVFCGLLSLHEVKRRALTIVACREPSSEVIFGQTSLSAVFRHIRLSQALDRASLLERLVAARLATAYTKVGFSPPYPTFPFTRQAIISAIGVSPRELLQRCQNHQEACLKQGGILECVSLAAASGKSQTRDEPRPISPPPLVPRPQRQSEILIGRSAQIGEIVGPIVLSTDLLRRHVAVLASVGKAGLLSRFIQEVALAGTPALVLDFNGDFARLGEPWPSRPAEFSDEDARKAKTYCNSVEVALWTPGVLAGQPITFDVLPDFESLRQANEPDSLEALETAIEMAMATLQPYLPARGPKAIRLRGALADALRVFARGGGHSFDDFVRLLDELPESAIRQAEGLQNTREIAEHLRVASATFPLLSQSGGPADFARLFEGSPGKTRVSVIHLAGLGDEERVAFAHRLQMALFSWIRSHPDPAGRLVVLDEAHLYAAGREASPAKRSALALVKQATRFGLGLVFASQAAHALDCIVVDSCLTRFYGAPGSPTDAAAVSALMTKSGVEADELTRLRLGEMYFQAKATRGRSSCAPRSVFLAARSIRRMFRNSLQSRDVVFAMNKFVGRPLAPSRLPTNR